MTTFNLYGRSAIEVEALLNDHKQRIREVLAPAPDFALIDFIDALRTGEGVDRFVIKDAEFPDARRFCELLAIIAVLGDLQRRFEVRELETAAPDAPACEQTSQPDP